MSKPLKIVSISSELDPYSKTGGLADVARSLPKALHRLGHEIIIITPFYNQLIDKNKYQIKLFLKDVNIYINSVESVRVSYHKAYLLNGLVVYFIESKEYLAKKKSPYASTQENACWMVFDVAALKLISLLKFEADIVHCHDWQTGLIPYYLKTDFRYSKTLKKAKTIFTIHNLVFQMGRNWWDVPLEEKDYGHSRLPRLSDPNLCNVNFVKRAILSADGISTVSEQYREEIMTKKFGQDLHRILKNREDRLFGIINGIDYHAYNPEKDPGLFRRYDHRKVKRKKLNKEHLQKLLSLPIDREVPVICLTSRIAYQKGFELFAELIEPLLRFDLQIIVMGDGDKNYIQTLKKFHKKHPKKIVWLPFKGNRRIETLIYAGSDIFLLPSHHEPCGINQLIAMRYGCIPVVRKVGGLNDTVQNFNPKTGRGNGFSFSAFNALALYGSIIAALENFKHRQVWRDLVVRAMRESNTWEIPAKKYVVLYKKILKTSNN
jgi:starch synthase